MDELIAKLWGAANIHCFNLCGEYLEPDAEELPEQPANNEDTIRAVTEYLYETSS